jgi:hypothetical protein
VFSSRTSARLRPTGAGLLAVGLVTTTILSTVVAQPAAAAPVFTAAQSSALADPTQLATPSDKFAAATVLGINPDVDMMVLNDQEFVLALWRQARDGSFIKAEALRAYDTTDSGAAYAFITTGIYAAADDDAQAEITAAHARALRRSVAVIVGLDPADTGLIEKNDRDFIFSVWQRVEAGSHVWTAARDAIADGTTQQDWTEFLTVDAQAAAEQDLRETITEGDAAQAARLRAEQLATAKRALLQLVLLPVTEELVNAPNRQFVLHVHFNAKGTEVKLAAQAVLNTSDAGIDKALSDFIFTGGAAANARDEEVAAAKELAGYRATTTAIRDAAKTDGYQPNLLAAAGRALTDGTLLGLQTFLLKGQEEARKLDEAFRAKATWDFDGDAKPDLLAADTDTGALHLYKGTGTGTIASGRTQPGSSGWNDFTALLSPGDFTGDGLNDVIVRTTAGELYLYKGAGTGRFAAGRTQIGTTGWNAYSTILSPGDFTGDGFSDLIARTTAGELYLYKGTGTGTLEPGRTLIGRSGWQAFTALLSPGDFTGDGFADLIVRTAAGELRLYRGDGKGGFLNNSTSIQIGRSGWDAFTAIVSPGDFTGDGRTDLIVRTEAGELRLYRGDGKGGFLDKSVSTQIGRSGWETLTIVS